MTDYYSSQEECDTAEHTYNNSNPRYKHFCQHYFTAGDEEQFQSSRDKTNGSNNTFKDNTNFEFEFWDGFKNVSGDCVTNTFRYIFHKFKKGIYIRIKDNKLITFLPFSKAKFINEWSSRICIEPKYKEGVVGFMKHINEMEGRKFNEKKVNKFPSGWYANNCLVRYEFPISEGDTGTQHLKNMFEELCQNRRIPDLELFINRRDFPMLKKDGTEPYDHIWDSDVHPLVSHLYEKYIPILSSVQSNGFADIPIPTIDDWARVKAPEGAFFPKTPAKHYYNDFSTPWDKRKPTAVFRGGSTGCGVTVETNPRLKVAYLSHITKKAKDGFPLLDAGITNWNLRPRKIKGEKYLKTIEIATLPFGTVEKLTPEQQSHFKYIIHIQGHVSAFRLSVELSMGSVVLVVDSPYKLWFQHLLKPYVHYIPIKEDLSDLLYLIEWCKSNDETCKTIAENAKLFYDTYLTKDGIFNYLESLLVNVKKHMGNYEYSPSLLDIQTKEEYEYFLSSSYKKGNVPVYGLPMVNYERCYNRYQAIRLLHFEKHLSFNSQIFKTKLSTVTECEVRGIKFAVKTSDDIIRVKENLHEAFIGIHEINHLLKQIPNFVYIFNSLLLDNGGVSVIMEKVEGITMMEWIKSDEFNILDFYLILSQLSLALHVAQKSCGFVHYDLFPWNILIKKLEEPQIYEYIISHDKVIRVKTHIVPIIIDYGKAHVIHKSTHYGVMNMCKTSTIQDIVTIVLSSVNQIIKDKQLVRKDESNLVYLINFFSNTKFCVRKLMSFPQMRHFVNENSSFSHLIYVEKHDLEHKTPMDFYEYISNTNTTHFEVSDSRTIDVNPIPVMTYFKFIYSTTKEGIEKVFESCKKRIPNIGDKVCVYYFFQLLGDLRYSQTFQSMLKKSTLKDFKVLQEYKTLNLSDEIHLNSQQRKIKNVEADDYSDYKEMIDFILTYRGNFEVSDVDRKDILEKYCHFQSSVIVKRYFADYETIKRI